MNRNAVTLRNARNATFGLSRGVAILLLCLIVSTPVLAQGPVTPVPITEAERRAAEDAARAQAAAVAAQAAQAAYQNALAQAEASRAAADQARAYANSLDAQNAAAAAQKASDLANQAVASAQVVLNSVVGFNNTIQEQQAEIRRLNGAINDLTSTITLQKAQIGAMTSDNAIKAEALAVETRKATDISRQPIISVPVAIMILTVLVLVVAAVFFVKSRKEIS